MEIEPLALANVLLPLLRQFCIGDYGIALGGAHAKGVADAESDVDLYLFARRFVPSEERTRLCHDFSSSITGVVNWGDDDFFVQGGTDFYFEEQKIECWLRDSDYIANAIVECREGMIRRDFVTWTVMGFYNHCVLSDVSHMIPVDDPENLLAGWKEQVRDYPPLLRDAIISTHLTAARFWPDNYHYQAAVQRGDLIYAMGIVQQVIHNLIQVVFALNQTYFTGDKKLGNALDHMAIAPLDFNERIDRLLLSGPGSAEDFLIRQRDDLRLLVREVEGLVADH